MSSILMAVNLVSGLFLMLSVLLQNRGTGVSGVFGGEGNVYRTKRGVERILFFATIILAIVFFGSAFAHLFLK